MARPHVDPEPAEETQREAAHQDLATAIVNLGKAAQQRKTARREFLASTAIVAAAITKQLRRGDYIDIPERKVSAHELFGDIHARFSGDDMEVATLPGATYAVTRVFDGKGRVQQVLCREGYPGDEAGLDWAILEDFDAVGDDPHAMTSPDNEIESYHRATADECLLFAREAQHVIDAFANELRGDANDFAAAAQQLTKLAVR
jgi:hypothetical protein